MEICTIETILKTSQNVLNFIDVVNSYLYG